MRIAILTLPLHTNYGGILQAYALQSYIESLGHEVKVISPWKKKGHRDIAMPLVYFKRIIERLFFRKKVSIRHGHPTKEFIHKNMHMFHIQSWDQISQNFDCIVVGSDQIWRKQYASMVGGLPIAFLDFAKNDNIIRVAYSASFGTDLWEYTDSETKTCKELAKKFLSISVREESGIALCKQHLEVDAIQTVDPTFLLRAKDYNALLTKRTQRHKYHKYIFSYILDSSDLAQSIIEETSSQLHEDLGYKIEIINYNERTFARVEEWLQSIRDAELVITDSFHASVFSLIFKKSFLVIPNSKRGNSRIESLLNDYGLSHRIIRTHNQLISVPLSIDYNALCVPDKINKRLLESMKYLSDTL